MTDSMIWYVKCLKSKKEKMKITISNFSVTGSFGIHTEDGVLGFFTIF